MSRNSERVPICVVGCGGMGHRHTIAYHTLEETGMSNVELMAVCDINRDNAGRIAGEVERLFGRKPLIFTDLDRMLANPDIAAVDVVTDGSSHHEIATAALAAGKHALVEKPLGITIRACRRIIDAAERSGAVLATAENYRRDPVNRMVRAVIDAGLLDDPLLMIQTSLGGSDVMAATPWRHLKEKGAIGLDMGVHYADIIRYYLGEYARIFGRGLIVEPVRRRPITENHPLISYREQTPTYPETIEATGEDSILAQYLMQSGATVQFSHLGGGRGSSRFERSVHGRRGALDIPRDRTGGAVRLRLEERTLEGKEILGLLPGFSLNAVTARLFGEDGVVYDLPDVPHAEMALDARLLAIEYHDFAEAVLQGRTPEVDGRDGMIAVAAILGAYESAAVGRAVELEELLSGAVRTYQEEIDDALGL
ncbi:MAG: Gfo/Idh/MocA family oxidoreductase [Caldilineaceae bacterium SB0661_bin_32]|uniref:Gfo/Idh/MocA family oxidoreductase n=1 Tax=Caldilineaceae bacterium SB0661_bin_32 TaxID=2605255 RepID=A0A6B1D336_9CHLR|nr:Gfo/Idh/MocA family oxidoreductase [Caldilineaceae bacterium SB0661_bin_32]